VSVTVLIPTIPTRPHLLNRACASVTEQSVPHEIVIERDDNRTGAAATRNRALERVTTEFVAFLDDDDELERNHLEVLTSTQAATGADLVYSWFWPVDGHDPFGWFGRPFDAPALRERNYIPITVLARTELVKDVGGFTNIPTYKLGDGAACEEWIMWLDLLDAGAKFVHAPERTWRWNHHGQNTQGCADRW
jgi:glycosyltransferase involved in cell wall biosynthesis